MEQIKLPQIYNVKDLIYKCSKISLKDYDNLPLGEYNNDKLKVKIEMKNKNTKEINIISNEYSFIIRFYEYGNDIIYTNKKENYIVNYIKSLGCNNEFLNVIKNNTNYYIYNNLVKANDKEYTINNNIAKKCIDSNYYIEYDFINNKKYLYI